MDAFVTSFSIYGEFALAMGFAVFLPFAMVVITLLTRTIARLQDQHRTPEKTPPLS